jgi:hypothetical protein
VTAAAAGGVVTASAARRCDVAALSAAAAVRTGIATAAAPPFSGLTRAARWVAARSPRSARTGAVTRDGAAVDLERQDQSHQKTERSSSHGGRQKQLSDQATMRRIAAFDAGHVSKN